MICSNTLQIYRIVQQLTGLLKLHSYSREKFLANLRFTHKLSTEAKINRVESVKTDVVPEKNNTDWTIRDLKKYLQVINPELLIKTKSYTCVQVSRRRPQRLWLVDNAAAGKIASCIVHDIPKDSIIVEINPGLALLTKHLVTAGPKELVLLETKNCFIDSLTKFCEVAGTNTNISIHRARASVWKHLNSIIMKEHSWTDVSPLKIISPVTSVSTFSDLVHQLSLGEGFMCYGLPEMYFIMYPSLYESQQNGNLNRRPRPSQIILENLYDTELLGSADRLAFLPWHVFSTTYPLKYIQSADAKVLHIVKFKPKANLHTLNISQEELLIYRAFLTILLRGSKNNALISRVEKQLPGFGLKLIQLNYNMSTRLSDITASEYLNIFKLAMEWPEFNTTSIGYQLKKCVTKSHQETELNEDIDIVHFNE